MLSLNQVTVVGRVLYEPDRGETATGKAHMVIDVETVEDVKDKQYTQALKIQVWGYLCEKLEYLRKDDILMVQGRFQERSWEGRDGTKHKVFDVVAREVSYEPMGRSAGAPKREAQPESGPESRQSQASAPAPATKPVSAAKSMLDDQIPF